MMNQIYASRSSLPLRLLALPAVLFCFVGCSAKAQVKSDRAKDDLLGAVHIVTSETVEVRRIDSPTNAQEPGKVEARYNPKGNKTEETRYKQDGSLLTRTVFDYDSDDILTSVTAYNADDTISLKRTYNTEYGNTGQRHEYIWAGGTSLVSKLTRKYDSGGRVIELATVDADGKPEDRQVMVYNTKGDLRQINYFFDRNPQLQTSKVIFHYNANGKLPEIDEQDGNDSSMVKRIFSGDTERGSDITASEYGSNGDLMSKERYVREFDSQGNWIKETKLVMNSKTGAWETVQITQRQITYY